MELSHIVWIINPNSMVDLGHIPHTIIRCAQFAHLLELGTLPDWCITLAVGVESISHNRLSRNLATAASFLLRLAIDAIHIQFSPL